MCEFSVDDPASVSHREPRKARKEHRCNECSAAIKPGEIYFHYWWVDSRGDRPDTAKACWPCEEATRLFADHHNGHHWFPGGNLGDDLVECARNSESFAEMMMWGRLSVSRDRRVRAAQEARRG